MMHPVMKNLFEPVENTHFEWCVLETKESVEELFATGEYQETEERILNALFDYRYLNRYNLTRLVGRGDIKKHLDKMLSQGIIGEYASPPTRTWLVTEPPRCAMPIVSAE